MTRTSMTSSMSEPSGWVSGPGSGVFKGLADTMFGPDHAERLRQRATERIEAELAQAKRELRWHYAGVALRILVWVIGLSTAAGFDILVWKAILG
jgi:hypothetical protein